MHCAPSRRRSADIERAARRVDFADLACASSVDRRVPYQSGNDPEQQYFADGITEDVTTDLSRLADMS